MTTPAFIAEHDAALRSVDVSALYGKECRPLLEPLQKALAAAATRISAHFYARLTDETPSFARVLDALSPAEREHLKEQQARNLQMLADPELSLTRHRSAALRIGRIHAIVGLAQNDLLLSQHVLHSAIREHIDVAANEGGLLLLMQRLIRDLAWQAEAYHELQASRHAVLLQTSRLVREVDSYADFISRCAQRLAAHDEIAACSFGKPDGQGVFRYEFLAGDESIVASLLEQEKPMLGDSTGRYLGISGRCWLSGQVERVRNCELDERIAVWRERARRFHVRSIAAIPLLENEQSVRAVLTLYCRFPGAYSSDDQQSFLEQLRSLLQFACTRLVSLPGGAGVVPYQRRRHWAELIRNGGLEMHYQPVVELRTGNLQKVEALARLRDEGRLVSPGEFLPALTSEDLLALYAHGLRQVVAQRQQWRAEGLDLRISMNLPARALIDPRYYDETRHVLEMGEAEPSAITFEVLESEGLPPGLDIARELQRYKDLGVALAEDDLGAGHSSLIRLRQLPFDIVKLDQGVVAFMGENPDHALHFVYQLTRLGHSLGKAVVVEGVETLELLEAVMVLGADAAQGYAIARPMPAVRLPDWMRSELPLALPDRHRPRGALAQRALWLMGEERRRLAESLASPAG